MKLNREDEVKETVSNYKNVNANYRNKVIHGSIYLGRERERERSSNHCFTS